MKLDSNQTPQDTISSKNGEIDQELFLFLARRKKVEENMKATVVPNRNKIFASIKASSPAIVLAILKVASMPDLVTL